MESYAQKIILKPIVGGFLTHSTELLKVLQQNFLRTAWITEGLGQNDRTQMNIIKLVGYTCDMIQASQTNNFYLVVEEGRQRRVPCSSDGVVDTVYFMLMRFNLHNRGPSHPANYEQVLLSSELYQDKVTSKIILIPEADRVMHVSKLQNMYFNLFATCCYNDPTQIPK